MRKIDRRIVIIVSVIFILGLAYGIMRFLIAMKEEPPSLRPIEARRYVKTEVVEYRDIAATVSEGGRLLPVAEFDIIAEASGRLQPGEVSLKQGARFSKGEVLFVVYPDEAILSLQARKSQYQNQLAGILPDLMIDYPAYEKGFRDFFNAISVDQPLPPYPEVEDEQLKIFLASRNVIGEYYNIQRDELQLLRRTTIAPFNGTFKEVYMELGTYTNTGGRVARAIRTDELELQVPLEKPDAAWVKIGDRVIVESENRTRTWDGKVIRKSPFVDENTQSQLVFIHINYRSDQPLLAGEYLFATFPVRPIEKVMEIPRNAVFNFNEIFLVKGGRLAKSSIDIVKVNERTLIFQGLPEGDTMVVQQLINVSEGTLVQLDNETGRTGGPSREKQGERP